MIAIQAPWIGRGEDEYKDPDGYFNATADDEDDCSDEENRKVERE